jgi:hypothetical protein
MQNPSVAGPAETTIECSDFELARNADGAWLLIVPELPTAILDNPLSPLRAAMEDTVLVLENSVTRLTFSSLIAGQYSKAIAADRPKELLLCIVDNEGIRTYSRSIPFDI